MLASSMEQACEFVNQFAPEHLSLPQDADDLLQRIQAAGTVFLGPWSAQPFGDYASGSNHVLPTAGWARARILKKGARVNVGEVQIVDASGQEVARVLATFLLTTSSFDYAPERHS